MADADPFVPFQELFDELFGGPLRSAPVGRGADLQQPLTISPREAREGARKTIEVHRRVLCEACEGSGRDAAAPECEACGGARRVSQTHGAVAVTTVCTKCKGRGHDERYDCGACEGGLVPRASEITIDVPPGVEDGTLVRSRGMGDEGRGGVSGDLYVALTIDGPTIEGSPYRGLTPGALAAERAAEEVRSRRQSEGAAMGEDPRMRIAVFVMIAVSVAIVLGLLFLD